jgi:hypothetical protein
MHGWYVHRAIADASVEPSHRQSATGPYPNAFNGSGSDEGIESMERVYGTVDEHELRSRWHTRLRSANIGSRNHRRR